MYYPNITEPQTLEQCFSYRETVLDRTFGYQPTTKQRVTTDNIESVLAYL